MLAILVCMVMLQGMAVAAPWLKPDIGHGLCFGARGGVPPPGVDTPAGAEAQSTLDCPLCLQLALPLPAQHDVPRKPVWQTREKGLNSGASPKSYAAAPPIPSRGPPY